MTPDPAMFASATTSRAAAATNRRHRSSHHRGKTAKSKKKKLWAQFSPWDASRESDFEDDDLVYFCRSRGISKSPVAATNTTASTTAPSGRAQTTNQLPGNRDVYRQRRQTTALPIQAQRVKAALENGEVNHKPETLAPEARVPASLCASLKDKGKFVRESRSLNVDSPNEIKSNQSGETHNCQKLLGESSPAPPTEHNDADADSTTTTSEENQSQHSGSSLPRLLGTNLTQATHDKRQTSLSRASGDFRRQGAARKSAKEWSADVETEIMRLYENSGPGSGLSILEAKTNAKTGFKMKDHVESKVNNLDHTPSYVLALANLFRRRMQIRKEFSQVSGEGTESSYKPSLPGSYSITNAFPAHKNSPRPCSHNPHDEDSSPVSLRYHHVTTINGTSGAVQVVPQTAVAKPGSVTFCSFATPISTGSPVVAVRKKFDKSTDLDPRCAETGNDTGQGEGSVADTATSAGTGLAAAASKPHTDETLETLLTVFPKPPQLKFATSVECGATKRHASNALEIQKTMNETPAKDKTDTTSLIMSVAATRKKEPKVTLPSKENDDLGLNTKHLRRRTEHKPLKPLGVARKCHSAETKQQDGSEYSRQQKGFDMTEFPPRKKVREFLLFDKASKPQSVDENSPLPTASTKVRWSGSLGTLYPKPKILGETVRCAAQADAISPRLMVNRLMSICDVTLTRGGNGKVKLPSDCQPKTELMTVSPIDKQKSAIAS